MTPSCSPVHAGETCEEMHPGYHHAVSYAEVEAAHAAGRFLFDQDGDSVRPDGYHGASLWVEYAARRADLGTNRAEHYSMDDPSYVLVPDEPPEPLSAAEVAEVLTLIGESATRLEVRT